MLTTLDVELDFVQRHNWSFRSYNQDFEYLLPTSRMVAAPHRANAQQVFRYQPSLRTKAEAHDHALALLREACQLAYDKLMHSPAFLRLPMPDPARPDDRKFVAEYVINGLRDLLPHYTLFEFWKTHGRDYLQVRSDPALASSFHSIEARGKSFQETVTVLRNSVSQLQERLADTAGLPPVDPAVR